MLIERELVQRDLDQARAELATFLDAVDDDRVLERLAAEVPLHPLLWVYRIGLFFMAMVLALCLASLAAPLVSLDLARQLARLDHLTAVPLPIVLLVVSYAFGAAGVSARWFAVQRGQRSPMLPWETRVHEDLSLAVRRCKAAARELDERGRDLSA